MGKYILIILSGYFLCACASQPEIPKQYEKVVTKQRKPQSVVRKKVSNRYQKYLAQNGLRSIETDCQIYSQPTLYSDRVETAKAGRDVWTEDTGSSWYKVYKNKQYGYMSKICFTQ